MTGGGVLVVLECLEDQRSVGSTASVKRNQIKYIFSKISKQKIGVIEHASNCRDRERSPQNF